MYKKFVFRFESPTYFSTSLQSSFASRVYKIKPYLFSSPGGGIKEIDPTFKFKITHDSLKS